MQTFPKRGIANCGHVLAEELKKIHLHRRTEYNKLINEPPEMAKIRMRLLFHADEAHRNYSQYVGHWDDWMLGRAVRDIECKSGDAAWIGDYVLVKPSGKPEMTVGGWKWHTTIYSSRLAGDCSVDCGSIELL